MRLTDIADRERPRERLLAHGASALSEAELVALLLGNGSHGENALALAARLLAAFGLEGLGKAPAEELSSLSGVGTAKACRLLAAFEVGRRLKITKSPARLRGAGDALRYCRPLIGHLEQEHVLVVFIDKRHRVLGHRIITKGLAGTALAHPREVFRDAIRTNAHAVIVAHNHPSGDATPSAEDEATAAALRRAGETIGITVLDSVVVTSWGGKRIR